MPGDQAARALDAAIAIREDQLRAQALIALAPHLLADQPPSVLARALDAVTAIQEFTHRAKALATLVPNLPTDQLARALDVGIRSPESAAAIFKRIGAAFAAGEAGEFLDLLRLSLNKAGDRAACLSVITELSSEIVETAGVEAAVETAKAIIDAGRTESGPACAVVIRSAAMAACALGPAARDGQGRHRRPRRR